MKKLSGFSLMEMMVVLLIVSVVAAASAPMINKKMVTAASDKSPWLWLGNSGNIGYNVASGGITAVIGRQNMPNIDADPRLYIDSDTPDTRPQITFGNGGNNPVHFRVQDGGVAITNDIGHNPDIGDSVLIGINTRANSPINAANANTAPRSVAIGRDARGAFESVTIGYHSHNEQENSVAIGSYAETNGEYAIAIGTGIKTSAGVSSPIAKEKCAIAIGTGEAEGPSSIALGGPHYIEEGFIAGPLARKENTIAIGSAAQAINKNAIAIGPGVSASRGAEDNTGSTVAIGLEAVTNNNNTIAIGTKPRALGDSSIAIGARSSDTSTKASGASSIAIGTSAVADAQEGIAIGKNAVINADHTNSVAIGSRSETTTANQIALGSGRETIFVRGDLVVDGNIAMRGGNYLYFEADSDSWGNYRSHWTKIGGVTKTYSADRYVARADLVDRPDFASIVGRGTARVTQDNSSAHRPDDTVSGSGRTSDKRLKNIGKAFIGGLEEIKKLEVFNYTFKKDPSKTPRVGVMAQDLQKIFPNAVTKGDDGFLRIRMEDMFYAVVNAIKELDAKIEKLKQEEILTLRNDIEKLKKENVELKKQNESFEKRLEKLEKKAK